MMTKQEGVRATGPLRWWPAVTVGLGAALLAEPALAQDELSAGDTAWMMTSSLLVLMMTLPGLALFYGGLVRAKNVLSILMQCMIAAGWIGVLWVVAGYSLAFSDNELIPGFIGSFDKVMLAGVTPDSISGTIPEYVFVMFQGMFAIITPALMVGAFAERMRFGPYLAFITIWLFVIYIPLAHMVWGGGLIGGGEGNLGALDFAGGLVVHMSSGFSALVVAIFLGARRGHGREAMPPHSLPLTVIGAALLWVGWFGFNAGSELAADGVAGLAFLTTQTATATAIVVWALIETIRRGKPTVLGAATAAVAGLVAITPACAFVGPGGAIAIGAGVAVLSYLAVEVLKPAWGYDDSLDVFGVHGVGGMWGALATGLFISQVPEGTTYLGQIGKQVFSIGITAVYSISLTLGILFVLRAVFGSLRANDEEEHAGLDLSLHSETAYQMAAVGSLLGQAQPSAEQRESA